MTENGQNPDSKNEIIFDTSIMEKLELEICE